MWHVRRGNDLIIFGSKQESVKKSPPIGFDKPPIGSFAKFRPGPTVGIPIDDDDGAILGLAARFGLGELGRVERAVASTPDHDDVPQRMSLPPSTTSTVPVT